MNFTQTITKEDISLLPVEEFKGKIIVINNKKDAKLAIEYLLCYKAVGFDTETRPSFKKGNHYKVALVQLSTDDVCFLFRLNKMGMPAELTDFFSSDSILKIGLSLRDDFNALKKRSEMELRNFVDLQDYVTQFGIEEASLQKIYAIVFHKKISKRSRLTNWEAPELTEAQKKYAALDAWSCLRIYKCLNREK